MVSNLRGYPRLVCSVGVQNFFPFIIWTTYLFYIEIKKISAEKFFQFINWAILHKLSFNSAVKMNSNSLTSSGHKSSAKQNKNQQTSRILRNKNKIKTNKIRALPNENRFWNVIKWSFNNGLVIKWFLFCFHNKQFLNWRLIVLLSLHKY